jgi:hypothetical protein
VWKCSGSLEYPQGGLNIYDFGEQLQEMNQALTANEPGLIGI